MVVTSDLARGCLELRAGDVGGRDGRGVLSVTCVVLTCDRVALRS